MRGAMWQRSSRESYTRMLERFAEHVGGDRLVSSITKDDGRSFLATFTNHAPATVALAHTILSSFFKTLVLDEQVESNPMDKIKRPKVPALRDRKRVRVTTEQVEHLLAACETWPERVCLHTAALLGARRTALANLRWRDVDGKRWTVTFTEKGNKVITKPVPHQLRAVWTAYAIECGPFSEDEWVIPNRRALGRTDSRAPRIVYAILKDVAGRCGIHVHVHALRAAFAVHFLRTNPAQLEALRQLMGHHSIATTQGYLDELEGEDAMRVVLDLGYRTEAA